MIGYTKEGSGIIVIGLNILTAPVELQEKFSILEAQWPQAIKELCALKHINEAAVLSTCDHMEVYVDALSRERGVKEVTDWMAKTSRVSVSELCNHRFLLYNEDAKRHLFEVASGLHSLVFRDPQILDQLKQVAIIGHRVCGFSKKMGLLLKYAINFGKRVRTETEFWAVLVLVSLDAVEPALMKKINKTNSRVLVVGAGEMGKLLIKYLVARGCKKIVLVNRTKERVASIIAEFPHTEIVYKPLPDLLSSASEADIIFTCTASETPLFFKEQVQKLPKIGTRVFIDISFPGNVESSVSNLETALVIDLGHLKDSTLANIESRQQAALKAQSFISEGLNKFKVWKDCREIINTKKKFTAYVERIQVAEMEICLSKLREDVSKKEKKAVRDLSKGIVDKILRGPMKHLTIEGGDGGRCLNEVLENARFLNRIFGLHTGTSEENI